MQIYADANCYLWPPSGTSWSSSGQCGDRIDNIRGIVVSIVVRVGSLVTEWAV